MKTLLMVKPDVVERGLYGDIISVVLHRGFNVTNLRMLSMDTATAECFYEVHKEREFFPDLLEYITSGPVVAIEIEGDEVVARVRDLIGLTDPANSSPGTIVSRWASWEFCEITPIATTIATSATMRPTGKRRRSLPATASACTPGSI